MFLLHSVNRLENLFDLVGLCLVPSFLNIHPWVSLPRSPVHPVACALLPRLAKIMITNPAQIGKEHVCRVVYGCCDYRFYFFHAN